jgi:hypothetical protein
MTTTDMNDRRIGGKRAEQEAEPVTIKEERPDEHPPQEWPVWALKVRQDYEAQIAQLQRDLMALRSKAMVVRSDPLTVVSPLRTLEEMEQQTSALVAIIRYQFKEGIHYGPPFEGSKKHCLLKVGAEMLASLYGVRPKYIELQVIEDWDRPLFHYRVECELISIGYAQTVGSGIGSCNSLEDKYRYRKQNRACPTCGSEAIMESKFADRKTGEKGWYCNAKAGGCGANFAKDDDRITNQEVGRTENTEIFTLVNTISKMAHKRAMMAAVLMLTGVSAWFDYSPEHDPEDSGKVVEGKATDKGTALSPFDVGALIEHVKDADPSLRNVDVKLVEDACLKALGLKFWNDPFQGTLDDAKRKVFLAVDRKRQEREQNAPQKSTPPEPPTGQKPDSPAKCRLCDNPADVLNLVDGTLCEACAGKEADRMAAKEATTGGALSQDPLFPPMHRAESDATK